MTTQAQAVPAQPAPHRCLFTLEEREGKDIYACTICNIGHVYLVSHRTPSVETVDEKCKELDQVISEFLAKHPKNTDVIFSKTRSGSFGNNSCDAFMDVTSKVDPAFATLTTTQATTLMQQMLKHGVLTSSISTALTRRDTNNQIPLFDQSISQQFMLAFQTRITNDPGLMHKLLTAFLNVPNRQVKELAKTMIAKLES
ncbi:hypothetical protein [Parashewanella tropica]|uniref:hypothetical protein n=1 Tax=Parashewanella tropica TaxID=2547970 RepID=UPI00105A2208|nr:hypothetical protein [Parashewanella tropica]